MKPLLPLGLTILLAASASADVKLPPVLSPHMVLQRDRSVPIWGTASPGEKVTVQFRTQTKSTEAGPDGKWRIDLDSLKAGGPDVLTVTGKNTLTLDDVLVGEVWVGSGQSNMALPTKGFTADDPLLAADSALEYPQLRLLTSGKPGWKIATPENNAEFSGLLFGFGFRLQKDLNIPVGIMVGAVGGTSSGFWVNKPYFDKDPVVQKAIADYTPIWTEEQKVAEAAQAEWLKTPAAAEPNAKTPVKFPRYKPGESHAPIGHLYEKNIRPLIPFAIRGVLWDQGENGSAVGGVDQYTTMGSLIAGWRQEWGQGDFPFLYVEKPSGWGTALDLKNPLTNKATPFGPLPNPILNDNDMRMEYIRIKDYPNTAMVTTSDLGNGTHPVNKSGYSARAETVAMGFTYKADREYYGPLYASHEIKGNKVTVRFTHLGGGLTVPEGQKLQGFALAGEDQKWAWADCTIEGDTVVLTSPKVEKPVAIRYAWSFRTQWANLFNKAGLPALSFRTDTWPTTNPPK